MKKTTSIICGVASLICSHVIAQSIQPCNTYEVMEQYFKANPSAKVNYDATQQQLKSESDYGNKSLMAGTVYTVPVVFHILHEYGPENISDQECINALAQVNKDFSRKGTDTASINSVFKGLYKDAEIVFKLAKKDPNGNCTNGIVHHYDTKTNWDQAQSYISCSTQYGYSGSTAWSRSKYLNIYIVKRIYSSIGSSGNGIIVGYTFLPGGSPCSNADAIVYRYDFLNGLEARSLSHEIGHWLNLAHTFGNTNDPGISCGDDGITDTPPTKGFYSTCPSSYSQCTSGQQENLENIMDYSSCPKMFTQQQINAMRSAVTSGTASRSNLWSTTNLTSTGVNTSTTCAPIADFIALKRTVCAGQTISFKDFSSNATATGWSWSFQGGSPSASSVSSPTITYNTPGTYSVGLTASNGMGNNTSTKTAYIVVKSGTADKSSTYSESFEGTGTPSGFTVINTSGVTWQQSSSAGASGSKSFYLNNATNAAGQVDILETPSYNFAPFANATFSFKYAYARKNSNQSDELVISASNDCGGSWIDIVTLSASAMATNSGGTTSTPFTPTSTQWKSYPLSNHPLFAQFKSSSNVRIRFNFKSDATNGNGNNFYIDDINFAAIVGIDELETSLGLSLYPNPTNDKAVIEFTTTKSSLVSIQVTDVLGKTIESITKPTIANELVKHTVNNESSLPKGLYFITLSLDGKKLTKKLIIE